MARRGPTREPNSLAPDGRKGLLPVYCERPKGNFVMKLDSVVGFMASAVTSVSINCACRPALRWGGGGGD